MVQATLRGDKTETRREIKHCGNSMHYDKRLCDWGLSNPSPELHKDNDWKWTLQTAVDDNAIFYLKCPYGKVGDVLWVRETTCYVMLDHAPDLLEGMDSQTVYKASVHPDWMEYAKEKYGYKWKPSIFMPKDACRIKLEITDVRVERLNEISDADAIAEGIIYHGNNDHNILTPKEAYQILWESINGKDSFGGQWVWVIKFKRVEGKK